jgi:hypothetical protein
VFAVRFRARAFELVEKAGERLDFLDIPIVDICRETRESQLSEAKELCPSAVGELDETAPTVVGIGEDIDVAGGGQGLYLARYRGLVQPEFHTQFAGARLLMRRQRLQEHDIARLSLPLRALDSVHHVHQRADHLLNII